MLNVAYTITLALVIGNFINFLVDKCSDKNYWKNINSNLNITSSCKKSESKSVKAYGIKRKFDVNIIRIIKSNFTPSTYLICLIIFYMCSHSSPSNLSNIPYHLSIICSIIFSTFLTTLSLIDLNSLYVPKPIIYTGVSIGLTISALDGFGEEFPKIIFHISASIAGYLLTLLLREVTNLILNKESLGKGDAGLVAMLGSWLGLTGLGLCILLAILASGIFSLFAFLFKRLELGQPYPLAPFICISGYLIWFFGNMFWIKIFFN